MYDIIIIGCGTAGLTAAIYARSSGKSVLLLEAESIGGQVAVTPKVENFPGFGEISGSELADKLLDHATSLGADIELEKVTSIKKLGDRHFSITGEYNSYECKAVIIASGAKPRHINVEGEDELVGNGVSYCAVCDGAFFKNEDVALIGDANTALIYTLQLSSLCRKVYLLTLFDRFFGEQELVDAVKQKSNVEIHHNLALTKFIKDGDSLAGLEMLNKESGDIETYAVKGCFISIGQVPDNKAFADIVNLDEKGYIIADESCCTSTEGIFVAGDCRTKKIRQLTTAASDGAIAALAANSYIDRVVRPVV